MNEGIGEEKTYISAPASDWWPEQVQTSAMGYFTSSDGVFGKDSSFKRSYSRGGRYGLDSFANSYWGNGVSRRSTTRLKTWITKHRAMTCQDAEDHLAIHCRGRILCCIQDGYRSNPAPKLPRECGFPQALDTPVHEDNTMCIE